VAPAPQASLRQVSYVPAPAPALAHVPAAPAATALPVELALRPALTLSRGSLHRIALHEALSPFVDALSFSPSSPQPAKKKKAIDPAPRLNASFTLASAR
jgi:hypothetical protein